MGGKSKTITDYITLGKQKGIDYRGTSAPKSVRETVEWLCPRCRRTRKASFFAVQQGENGCRCHNKRSLDEADYVQLAERLGIKWVAKTLPKNNKTLTEWQGPSGEMVLLPYHTLAYKKPPHDILVRLGLVDAEEDSQ